ncbi:type II toxin-antitoxin system VapC family toxin [Salinarimonas sp. NSM]|uniref:type II toxin-antitoxin system VapC family toxin n=1 Tax=Salinarimonas sp. NSM TaxID=3458003 RepID=UPI004034FD5A
MMFVDASALVAIINREPGWEVVLDRIDRHSGLRHVSPLVRFEATLGVARSLRGNAPSEATHIAAARALVDSLIDDIGAGDVPISEAIGELALDAAALYGRAAGHPARLNFGDCFSYACAKMLGTGLLYVGDDFSRTDLA